ncbi:endonuclease domain-containing 1 protein-like [Ictalurus punctatus]|uniref:Endonuclease domain-containing 1 protein-like n=1 Tax=Ictalurus punctatus TaxID=7998 RepID=A0A9F7QXA7_ICTPU|nr:endonuclease domain-containing 1 protein-like [Ictalurus punctatus]
MKFLSVVLLLLPLSLCLAVVVDDFTVSCPGFFATPNHVVSPPTGFTGTQYKRICQTLNNKAEFATLYDTTYRIPVYSAYRFTGLMKCNRLDKWHTEPELEVGMQDQNQKTCLVNQAVNGDYKYSGYDRGHLAPVFHATSQDCADATFTLTNAAPQIHLFNQKWSDYAESTVANVLNTDCINVGLRAFVVTGVVPDNKKMNNRVQIPSHFWTAFCCLDNNNKTIRSSAYYGEKDESEKEKNESVKEKDEFVVYRWSVKDMETELTQLYKIHVNNIPDFRFTLFAGKCYTETEPMEKQLVEKPAKRKKGTKYCKSNKRRKL